MRNYLEATILTPSILVVLVPLASNAQAGLQRVLQSLRIEEHTPMWIGLMPDYSVPAIGDCAISKLIAGTFGFLLFSSVAFLARNGNVQIKEKSL